MITEELEKQFAESEKRRKSIEQTRNEPPHLKEKISTLEKTIEEQLRQIDEMKEREKTIALLIDSLGTKIREAREIQEKYYRKLLGITPSIVKAEVAES